MTPQKDPGGGIKIVAENRKARYDYQILEAYEAGLVLQGGEVKSIRAGHVVLQGSYVYPRGEELFLIGAHITPYKFDTLNAEEATRSRKLLLHRHEIHKLIARIEQKGLTLVPLKLYLKRGKVKLEIGLARGKNKGDRRESEKKRDSDREIQRAVRGEKQ